MMATPKIEMKPTAAEMLKLVPVRQQRPDAAHRQAEHVGQHHQGVQQRAEGQVQQHEDQAPATAG